MNITEGVRTCLLRALLVVGAGLVVVACGGPEPPRSGSSGPIPIVIQTEARPMLACAMAEIEGRLALDPRWGVGLQSPETGEVRRVVFPFGYAAFATDVATIVDPTGRVVAHVGDVIHSGGGIGPNGEVHVCGL